MTDTTFQARPTIHNGIQMRSRLEAGFAQWLDGQGIPWEYEPCAFGSKDGQYLPDFLIPDPEHPLFVEVKPYFLDAAEPDEEYQEMLGFLVVSFGGSLYPKMEQLGRRMSIIWESVPDADLAVFWPNMKDEDGYCGLSYQRVAPGEIDKRMKEPGIWKSFPVPVEPPWAGRWWEAK